MNNNTIIFFHVDKYIHPWRQRCMWCVMSYLVVGAQRVKYNTQVFLLHYITTLVFRLPLAQLVRIQVGLLQSILKM